MGRTSALTYEQVTAVVDSLRAKEIKPTIDRVWQELGNVGSKGTVHKMVKRYLTELDEARKTPQSLRLLPPEIQNIILAYADQTAATTRQQIANELLDAKQEATTLAEETIRLDAQSEELRAQLAQALSERATMDGRAAQLEAELTTVRAEKAAERALLDESRNALARAGQQLQAAAAIEEELRICRAERDGHRDARVEAERKSAVLEVQYAQSEELLSEVKISLTRMQDICARQEEKNRELQHRLDGERQIRTALERDLAVLMAVQQNKRIVPGPKKRQLKQVDMFGGSNLVSEGTATTS